ncbi:hypothetical protein Nepgr_027417 [Nepenthes gracilis]|uniref:SET domain-containing protein n=1 Tax=Nepenthes gracilis TaxID=150966 RepID=A0AAD3Y331_NEPGR|nr:hypothetical protein Nepgr_027417 [Nepenthes gracilis]
MPPVVRNSGWSSCQFRQLLRFGMCPRFKFSLYATVSTAAGSATAKGEERTQSRPPPIRVALTESAGRGVFATRRIGAGELIHTAKAFVSHPSISCINSVCYFCLRKLKPKDNSQAPFAPFCSEDCWNQAKAFYQVEKKVDWSIYHHYCRSHRLKFPLVVKRLACMVISGAASTDSLEILQPGHLSTEAILKMEEEYRLLMNAFEAANFRSDVLEFLTKQWYIETLARVHINAFRIELVGESFKDVLSAAAASVNAEAAVGNAVYVLPSFYNHDCDPNAHIIWIDNLDARMKALREIEEGEELRICYIDTSMDREARQHVLLNGFGFKCSCHRVILSNITCIIDDNIIINRQFSKNLSILNRVILHTTLNQHWKMREEEIEKLRGVVRDCVSKHLYSSAIFFADKVAAFTSDPADIYMQAQALFLGRHYRRAFHLLNASQIVLRDLRFRYLAAKCLEELKEWDQCLQMLSDAKVDELGNVSDSKEGNLMYIDKDGEDREINISSAICFLRGRAYEALENRVQARQWYKAAIRADPLCYEALEHLTENHMLSCEEEADLLSSLQFAHGDEWLSSFYSCVVKKHDKENIVEDKFRELEKESIGRKPSDSSFTGTLKNNTDLSVCKAEYYHQCGEYQKCFEVTTQLLEKDPFHLKCTLVHLAAAVELGHSNELYIMSCNLVKDYPQKALSWFAVGCYYYCIKKYAQSHRYFSKATSLDGTFAAAWIGLGNAFAAQEEGDQAMLSYRTAARLFPGCHLPTLYIGMEYMRTHNFKLAEQFFMQAKTICPSDPLVYNELGVVAYHMKEYKKAAWWFEKTLAHVPTSITETWEPTIVNLAHALRKLEKYRDAISYYEKGLTLSTRSLSTYSGLAYTYHLQGNYSAAITYYHKALWLKADDQFCTEMLTSALADLSCQGIDSILESPS